LNTYHLIIKIEYQMLYRRVKQTSLPKSAYIRFMVMGSSPQKRQDDRFYVVMRQLAGMCNNACQLATKANALGFIDIPMYKYKWEAYQKNGAGFIWIFTVASQCRNLWIFPRRWNAENDYLKARTI